MKKFLVIFLSLILLLSLCACAQNAKPTESTKNQVEKPSEQIQPSSSSTAPATQPQKPITIEYDESTKTILVSGNGVIRDYNSASSRGHDDYKDEAVRIVIEEGCTGIGNEAFSDFSQVTEVVLPSTLTYIGEYAFSSCKSMISIDLPDCVTEIKKYAFKNCSALQSIDLPESLHTMDSGAFENCETLTEVKIYDSIRYLAPYVFKWCPVVYTEFNGIEYLGNAENPYVVAIGVLDNKAETYTLAENTVMVGPYAFTECDLTNITIPQSVRILASSAFKGCGNLTNITLPEGLLRIGDECFKYDGGLENISLPSTLTHIGMNAFDECYELSQITLPKSLVEIGNTAFKYTNIEEMTYLGSVADWEKIVKQDSGTNATVHCTDGDVTY